LLPMVTDRGAFETLRALYVFREAQPLGGS
jgi:hypothetical protein